MDLELCNAIVVCHVVLRFVVWFLFFLKLILILDFKNIENIILGHVCLRFFKNCFRSEKQGKQ